MYRTDQPVLTIALTGHV